MFISIERDEKMAIKKINTLEIVNLSGGYEPCLYSYGNIRETLKSSSYTFSSGIYVIECECFDGGWALSSLLSGKEKSDSGKIIVNGNEVKAKELRKTYSCVIGDESELRKFGFMHMKIREQIEYGIKRGRSFCNSFEQIRDQFLLSHTRVEREMENVGIERWRISMAIGYANGKIIYCLPWTNSWYLEGLSKCLTECLPMLMSVGAIVIIPTTTEDYVKDILTDYKRVKLSDMYNNCDISNQH